MIRDVTNYIILSLEIHSQYLNIYTGISLHVKSKTISKIFRNHGSFITWRPPAELHQIFIFFMNGSNNL